MTSPTYHRLTMTLLLVLMLSLLRGVAHAETVSQPQQARFDSHWDGRWQAQRRDGLCVLELAIADYGSARFIAEPGLPISFEVVGRQDLLAAHGVSLRTIAPAWHPRFPYAGDWQRATHVPGFGVRVEAPLANRLLVEFYEGFEQQLGANGMYGSAPALLLQLSVLKFRAAYDDFNRCQQGIRPDSLLALHRTRVHFDSASHEVGPKHRKQVQQVAAYVLQDPRVARVYVDGYTDDVGTDQANGSLSERRARAVAAVLTQAGVPPSLLVVRHHGERYPVATNGSDEARSRNRRATVRVELSAATTGSLDAQ